MQFSLINSIDRLALHPHPKREKGKYFGEVIQMDASEFDFLENGTVVHLHLAVDDATGTVVGAHFDY